MYPFLLTRRWLGLLAGTLVVAAICVALGLWQLDRLQQRHARNDLIRANLAATPLAADRLLQVGRPLPDDQQWRRVTVRGRYDAAHELLVRNRPLQGATGYYVVTPLVTQEGPALLVDRGWVPAGETAAAPADVPPPPTGAVTVVARMRQSEPPAGSGGLPPGQVARIDVPRIAKGLPYDVYGGFGELIRQTPRPGEAPRLLPEPEVGEGPHLAYAFQWFLFAAIALGGYVVLARREARDAAAAESAKVPAGVGG